MCVCGVCETKPKLRFERAPGGDEIKKNAQRPAERFGGARRPQLNGVGPAPGSIALHPPTHPHTHTHTHTHTHAHTPDTPLDYGAVLHFLVPPAQRRRPVKRRKRQKKETSDAEHRESLFISFLENRRLLKAVWKTKSCRPTPPLCPPPPQRKKMKLENESRRTRPPGTRRGDERRGRLRVVHGSHRKAHHKR